MKQPTRQILGQVAMAAGLLGLSGRALASDPPPRAPHARVETLVGKVEGQATPGSRIRLGLEKPARAGSRYCWVQTAGPPLSLEGQTAPELKLTVPRDAESLGLILVVGDDQGVRTVAFQVPVEARPSEVALTANAATETVSGPRADAGDDAIGLVGRRVTLNGSESGPKDGLSYRWFQVDGPQAVGLDEAARFCSFVPPAPGDYRFGLVVAHENRISPPDFVVVSVGALPASAGGPGASATLPPLPLSGPGHQAVAPPMLPGLPAAVVPNPLDAAVAQALASLDDAPVVAGPLAEVFQATSLRMDLYRNYGEIFSEISRRLDAVVPPDPARRGRWNTLLFEPLTAQTVATLLPLGLDLRVAGSQDLPLTAAQRQALRGLFDRLSRRLASPKASR